MKVLLIRFSSLGDLILLTSIFDPLKKAGIEFDILTDRRFSELFEEDRRIGKVFAISDYSIGSLKRTAEVVKSNSYDYIFDLHGTGKSFLLSLLVGRKVLRYRKHSLLRRAGTVFKSLKSKWLYVPDMYAEPFRKIGLKVENPRPSVQIPEKVKERVKPLIPQSPFIVVSPGARWEGKRYPVERFGQISKMFRERGFKTAVVGGKEDFQVGESIEGAANLSGRLSVLESMAVISEARLVISNDSACVHMARAVNTKVISIFGSTHPFFGFAPYPDEGVAVTLNLPCSPCSLHGKTSCKDRKCFDIPAEVIVEKGLELMAEN